MQTLSVSGLETKKRGGKEDRDEAERRNEHKDGDRFRILIAGPDMTRCVPKVWSSFVEV